VDVVWIKLKKRGEVAILSAQSKHFLKKEWHGQSEVAICRFGADILRGRGDIGGSDMIRRSEEY
jgi:hypothetical protein